MNPWQCYAHPPKLGGKECGHLNTTERISRSLTYCEACGCTKIASDDRKRRKEARTP